MVGTISTVNQQQNLSQAKQPAIRPQQKPSFKQYTYEGATDSYGSTEAEQPQDNSFRNKVIAAAVGLGALVGLSFATKHAFIPGSTKKGAEKYIESGFKRGIRHVTDAITMPFEKLAGLFKGKKKINEGSTPQKLLNTQEGSLETFNKTENKSFAVTKPVEVDNSQTLRNKKTGQIVKRQPDATPHKSKASSAVETPPEDLIQMRAKKAPEKSEYLNPKGTENFNKASAEQTAANWKESGPAGEPVLSKAAAKKPKKKVTTKKKSTANDKTTTKTKKKPITAKKKAATKKTKKK